MIFFHHTLCLQLLFDGVHWIKVVSLFFFTSFTSQFRKVKKAKRQSIGAFLDDESCFSEKQTVVFLHENLNRWLLVFKMLLSDILDNFVRHI